VRTDIETGALNLTGTLTRQGTDLNVLMSFLKVAIEREASRTAIPAPRKFNGLLIWSPHQWNFVYIMALLFVDYLFC
jgi:hypothetical protein